MTVRRHPDPPLVGVPWDGDRMSTRHTSSERAAEPGELCTCGRQAVVVFTSRPGDPVGHCGLDNGGRPAGDWCPFCENELRHDAAGVNGPIPQGERCPRYRLRLAP